MRLNQGWYYKGRYYDNPKVHSILYFLNYSRCKAKESRPKVKCEGSVTGNTDETQYFIKVLEPVNNLIDGKICEEGNDVLIVVDQHEEEVGKE
jgi:hypothetical protein